MDEGIIARLAELLKGGNKFGGATFGGNKFGGNKIGGEKFGASAMPKIEQTSPSPFMASGGNSQELQRLQWEEETQRRMRALPQMLGHPSGATSTPQPQPVQTMPPTTVTAPAPQIPAPGGPPLASNAPAASPEMTAADYGTLALPQTQAASGMAKMPQTMAELDQWRKIMDAMQFRRQGV